MGACSQGDKIPSSKDVKTVIDESLVGRWFFTSIQPTVQSLSDKEKETFKAIDEGKDKVSYIFKKDGTFDYLSPEKNLKGVWCTTEDKKGLFTTMEGGKEEYAQIEKAGDGKINFKNLNGENDKMMGTLIKVDKLIIGDWKVSNLELPADAPDSTKKAAELFMNNKDKIMYKFNQDGTFVIDGLKVTGKWAIGDDGINLVSVNEGSTAEDKATIEIVSEKILVLQNLGEAKEKITLMK
jgi:hypothetical protein